MSYGSFAQNHLTTTSSDQLYSDALELLQQSNYGAARQAFEKYIAKADNSVLKQNAEYYVAFSALSLYHQDGEGLLSSFIESYPNHPKSKVAYYELGDFYYRQKKYKKASSYFEKADFKSLGREDKHAAYFKKGYSYFTERKFDDALKSFDEIKTQDGQYKAAASYYAGYIEYENGSYDLALTDLKRASQNKSYANMVPYMISNVYYKQKEYAKLQSYAEPLLSSGQKITSRTDVTLLVAEAYFHQGDYKKANDYFASYTTKGKLAPELAYRMGYAAYVAKDTNRAIGYFKQANKKDDPLTDQSNYYLGVLYTDQGNKQLAMTSFGQLLNDKVEAGLKEEAVYQSAKLHYESNRTHQAITLMRGYLLEFPNGKYRSEVSNLLTQAYFNESDYDEALKYIKTLSTKSLDVKKVYQKATFHKGVEHFNKEQYAKAVQLFDESLTYPLNSEYELGAYFWKGEAYAIGKKYPEAIAAYQKVLWNPASQGTEYQLKSRYGLGYAYFDNKEYDKALTQFREYVRTGSGKISKRNHHDATIRLADCHYVTKDYPKAIQYYEESIGQSRVDNDYSFLHLGLVNGIEGNRNEAKKAFDEVITKHTRSRYYDDALYNKAQLFFENGEYSPAISTFSKLITDKPKSKYVPYALLKRASANYNVKSYDQTITDYEKIIDDFPSHSIAQEVLLPLQEVLTLQGKSGEFDQYLAKYKAANPDGEGLENVQYEAAKTLYFNQEYENAIAKLKAHMSSYPESGLIDDVKYYIAESYYRLDDRENALVYYNQLVSKENYAQYHRILGRVAELEFKQDRYENAIYFYQQYGDLARSKKHQFAAYQGLMESYYLTENYDSTKVYAQRILDLGGVNAGGVNKAMLYLAKGSIGKDDLVTAEDELLATLNVAKDEYGAEAQYLLGDVQYQNSQYEQSIETLIELNNGFHAYDVWVGRGFLLIADNYVAMGEGGAAVGTLKSIIDGFPLEEIVNAAKLKLATIEAQEEEESLQLDSIDTVQDTLYTDQ